MNPVDRFFKKISVNERTLCCLWTGRVDAWGYGRFFVDKANWTAHRFSWQMHFGDIPTGMVVRHGCDVPRCVNPTHLELGSHADNMADMKLRGRSSRKFGEANGRHVLKAEDVKEIRERRKAGVPAASLANKFRVCVSTIEHACRGRTWKHLS